MKCARSANDGWWPKRPSSGTRKARAISFMSPLRWRRSVKGKARFQQKFLYDYALLNLAFFPNPSEEA